MQPTKTQRHPFKSPVKNKYCISCLTDHWTTYSKEEARILWHVEAKSCRDEALKNKTKKHAVQEVHDLTCMLLQKQIQLQKTRWDNFGGSDIGKFNIAAQGKATKQAIS